MPVVELDELYAVLQTWTMARLTKPQSYSEPSRQYKIRTNNGSSLMEVGTELLVN